MKSHRHLSAGSLIAGAAALLLTASLAVGANPDPLEAAETTQAGAQITDRVSDHFAIFAGGEANATALVSGLHDGTAVTLTVTSNGQTLTTTFVPTTGPMSYRDVFLALALAEEQLTKLGITQPTPDQVQAALQGGAVTTGSGGAATTTQLTGVLVLRKQNQAWSQVAQSLGVDLHSAVSAARAVSDSGVAAEAGQSEEAALSRGARATDRLADRFATFAGGEDNATALVNGLRNGTAISLTSTVNGQTTTTTFTPTGSAMGYGNVNLALSLAQQDLAKAGITQPTPAQIQAALEGGSVTTGAGSAAVTTQLTGVLVLRSQGQGWGQIAQSLGVSLHPMADADDAAGAVETPSKASATTGAMADADANEHESAAAHTAAVVSAHAAVPTMTAQTDASEAARAAAAASARPEIPRVPHFDRPEVPQVPHFDRPDIPERPEIPGHH